MDDKITVAVTVNAPAEKAWECYNSPEHITQWNHASDDWHSPSAENDLRVGGTFNYRMEAKDGSEGFNFTGTYTEIEPNRLVGYKLDDGREVRTTFEQAGDTTIVTTMFDPENENPREMQAGGWQAILDNFKAYVEQR